MVISGRGRGKGLGFPTLNLHIPPSFSVGFSPGIYAAWVKVKKEIYKGALYFGKSPTFGDDELTLEVHLIGTLLFHAEAGEQVEVVVEKFIRGDQAFSSSELLALQMGHDVAAVEKALEGTKPRFD